VNSKVFLFTRLQLASETSGLKGRVKTASFFSHGRAVAKIVCALFTFFLYLSLFSPSGERKKAGEDGCRA